MKKRVLSLLMAVTLCFSTVPMTAFAQEAGTSTEQETTGTETASETVPEVTSEPQSEVTAYEADTPGEDITDISGGDAVVQDAALNTLVAVQSGGHVVHPMCGATCGHNSHDQIDTWEPILWDSDLNQITEAGYYYLVWDVSLYDGTWTPANGVVLCLNGHSITAEGDFDAITVQDGVEFTLTDCNGSKSTHNFTDVDNDECKWKPDDTGTKTVTGGIITHSAGKMGSGVNVEQGGIFTMYGGNISGNANDTAQGGGVYAKYGTFNMYGGSICGNKAYSNGKGIGGGVLMNGGTFNMSGNAKITDNTASKNGGGVVVVTATFNMSDNAEITDNVAETGAGGGVYAYVMSTFNMSDNAKITNNNAKATNTGTGGGVHLLGGDFTMKDNAVISGNSAAGNGGGVCAQAGTFNLSGAVQIKGNNANGNKSNVYLWDKTIRITSNLDQQSEIGITTATTPAEGKPVVFAEAASGVTLSDEDVKVFSIDSNDNSEYNVQCIENSLYLYLGEPHRHPLCGKSCTHTDTDAHAIDLPWKGVSSLNEIKADGNYYLTADVTLTNTWTCDYNVNLCLNGKTITGAKEKVTIKVYRKSLTITDCQATSGKITHNSGETGAGIDVYDTLTLWNGNIVDNRTTGENGAGVWVSDEGTFNMNGGTISGNKVEADKETYHGGGVFVGRGSKPTDGTFNMNGGSITGNTSTGGGGGVYMESGTFNMTGGTIRGNNSLTAEYDYGAGVYLYGGQTEMNVSGNVQITDNWWKGTWNTETDIYEKGANGEASNVYLAGIRNKLATITVKGLSENARIGINESGSNRPTEGNYVTVATGEVKDRSQCFSADAGDPYNIKELDGKLVLINGDLHEHPICGEKCTHVKEDGTTEHGDVAWTGISDLSQITTEGNYFLTKDIDLTSTWTPVDGVVLDLNGHTISKENKADSLPEAILVNSSITFTMTDCTGNGKITHKDGSEGRGVS